MKNIISNIFFFRKYTFTNSRFYEDSILSKKSIFKGTLILTVAGVATKLLGFYNRIFLTRLIGVKELGIYQLIFPMYLLAFSICCQGIATTLTKQVSYYIGKKCPDNAKKVFKYSIALSLSISIIIVIVFNLMAYPISLHILKNTDCAELLKIITIAIPFVCVKACINSYFVGIDIPAYQGISHFTEQIFRIGTAYFLAAFWTSDKVNAVLAVTAVVAGEIFATILSIIIYKYHISKTKNLKINTGNANSDTKKAGVSCESSIIRNLLLDAVPITVNNVMFTLFSSFEAILMPAMLFYYYNNSDTAMEMFGIVTGIVVPFLLFPSTITTSLSTMLLPAVSYANAKQDKNAIRSALTNSILFCLMLGACAWLFYQLLGEPACRIFFKSETAGTILKKMSFLCPLIYLSGNLSAIMNGIDKAFHNLMYNILGISIRILFSVTLVPSYGLTAYIYGMAASYIVLDILLMLSVTKQPKKHISTARKV